MREKLKTEYVGLKATRVIKPEEEVVFIMVEIISVL
jgi:hypothetical protein